MNRIIFLSVFTLVCLYSKAQTFTLKSNDLGGQASQKQVYNGGACKGENISPQLTWAHPPAGTKSYAITIYDESAPTGSGWWHWLVVNIPLHVTELPSNAGNITAKLLPAGALQTMTDFGAPGYGGPCPPPGTGIHKYVVTVHALDTDQLQVQAATSAPIVGFQINAHTIQKASLIFYYKQ